MGKFYFSKIQGAKILLFSAVMCGSVNVMGREGDKAVVLPGTKKMNYKTFTPTRYNTSEEAAKANKGYEKNPEFGKLFPDAPVKSCYELMSARTEHTKTYVLAGSNGHDRAVQYGTDAIHYKDKDGNWRTVHSNLEPGNVPGIFTVDEQEAPVVINTNTKEVIFGDKKHAVSFDKDLELIYVKPDGTEQMLGKADWSHYTAGDDGIYVKNMWPGIDMDIYVQRNKLKTSFYLNQAMPAYAGGKLRFRDHVALQSGHILENKENAQEFKGAIGLADATGNLYAQMNEAIGFEQYDSKATVEALNYHLNGNNEVDIEVPGSFLNRENKSYPIVIDPSFSFNYSTPGQGATYSNPIGTLYCTTTAPVPIPSGANLYDIQATCQYNSNAGVDDGNGQFRFRIGTCANAFNGCVGSMLPCTYGNNYSIWSFVSPCVPAVTCIPYNLNILADLSQNYATTPPCVNTYMLWSSSLVYTIFYHTVDVQSFSTIPTSGNICQGSCGTISAIGIYGVSPYFYQWGTNPGNVPIAGATDSFVTVCPTVQTTYVCTIYDQCGNSNAVSYTQNVLNNNNPGFTITPDTACVGSNIAIAGLPAGQPASFYNWTLPGSNTPVVTAQQNFNATYSTAGTYNITLTPPNNSTCAFPLTQPVYVVNPPTVVSNSFVSPTHCLGTDGSMTFNGLTNGLSYYITYSFNGTPTTIGPIIAASGSVTLPGLSAGSYTNISVVYGSCGSTPIAGPITLADPASPVTNIGSNSPVCAGQTVNLTSNPDQAPVIFNWTGTGGIANATSQNASIPGAATGNYTISLSVSNTNTNCVTVNTISVVVNNVPAPTITAGGSPTTFCQGGSVLLTSNAGIGITPLWNLNGSPAPGTNNGATYIANQSGNYTVTETNTSLCSATSSPIAVTVNPAPTVTTSNNTPICAGQTLQLNSVSNPTSPSVSYLWAGPSGFSSTMQNPTLVNAQTGNGGTYTLTVTNTVTNCPATSTVVAVVNSKPVANVSPLNTTLCTGDSVILDGLPAGGTYQWLNNPSAPIAGATNQNYTVYNAGSYRLAVSNASGCADTSGVAVVNVNPVPSATATAGGPTTFCDGDNVVLTAGSNFGVGYQWYQNGQSIPNAINNDFTATQSGNYQVEVFSATGCHQLSAPISVTVKPVPVIPVTGNSGPICVGDSLVLNGNSTTSGVVYSWSGPSGFTSNSQSPVIYNAQLNNGGTYSVTATLNGCISEAGITLAKVNAIPSIPILSTNAPICPQTTLELFAADSTPNASFIWRGPNNFVSGQQNPVLENAPIENGGTYTVTATANGCVSAPGYIDVVITPIISIVTTTKDTVCQRENVTVNFAGSIWTNAEYKWDFDGGVIVSGSGTGPYIIKWDSSGKKTISVAVTYNNCTVVGTHAVTVLENIRLYPSTDKDVCVNQPVRFDVSYNTAPPQSWAWSWSFGNDVIILNGTMNQGPFVIEWTKAGQQVIRLLKTGDICLDALDDTVMVHDPSDQVQIITNRTQLCTGDTLTLSTQLIPGFSYAWTPEGYFTSQNTNQVLANIYQPGYVKVTITDEYGCKAADSVLLNATPCCDMKFPNAFTPNADGKNDVFRPLNYGHHSITQFRIENRWGQTIFNTLNESASWDGTFNGVQQDIGVYYWYIKYKCSDGAIMEKKGEVTLMR